MIRSPFATDSFEPRFVIEHSSEPALRAAIQLWRSIDAMFFREDLAWLAPSPRTLVVSYRARTDTLDDPIRLGDLPAWIMRWLASATYDEQPNFDGSEARGYAVFNGYFRAADLHQGQLAVTTKWIEIHK